MQGLELANELGVQICAPKWSMLELKGNAFRDEPCLQICGRTPEEVSVEAITAIGRKWKNVPALLIFDQNIDFGHTVVLGSDLVKALRRMNFTGVLLIRSGNDSADDEEAYLECGADGMLPKTSKFAVLVPELKTWSNIAMARVQATAGTPESM